MNYIIKCIEKNYCDEEARLQIMEDFIQLYDNYELLENYKREDIIFINEIIRYTETIIIFSHKQNRNELFMWNIQSSILNLLATRYELESYKSNDILILPNSSNEFKYVFYIFEPSMEVDWLTLRNNEPTFLTESTFTQILYITPEEKCKIKWTDEITVKLSEFSRCSVLKNNKVVSGVKGKNDCLSRGDFSTSAYTDDQNKNLVIINNGDHSNIIIISKI